MNEKGLRYITYYIETTIWQKSNFYNEPFLTLNDYMNLHFIVLTEKLAHVIVLTEKLALLQVQHVKEERYMALVGCRPAVGRLTVLL